MKYLLILFIILDTLFSINASAQDFSIKGDSTVFPINTTYMQYVNQQCPVAMKNFTIDTTGFVNVMNFGAVGNGITVDDNAIRNAINAAPNGKGVIFPSGKTFLSSTVIVIALTKDITIYAVGATFKKQNLSRYSFIDFDPSTSPFTYTHSVIWYGGTLDGNRANQNYPQASNGFDSTLWEENHGALLTVRHAVFAMAYDVNVVNSVMDGVNFIGCKLGVYSKDTAINGAPIKFSEVQQQATYFKNSKQGMKTTYFFDVSCDGGSIGMQPSWPQTSQPVDPETVTVMNNVKVWNTREDGIHIEDCYKNFLFNVTVGSDNNSFYKPSLLVSNDTRIFAGLNCHFINSHTDMVQGQSLLIGLIANSDFTGSVSYEKLYQSVSHMANVTVNGHGFSSTEVGDVKYAKNVSVSNFAHLTALRALYTAWNCNFTNGTIVPTSLRTGGVRVNCTYINCPTQTNSNPIDTSYRNPFQSFMDIFDESNHKIERIKCDGSTSATATIPTSRYYRDQDGDTYGNISVHKDSTARPSGYVSDSSDCNDASSSVHPNALEVCGNGVDDNCNGQTDECTRYYRDADLDGYGNAAVHKDSTAMPVGYIANSLDCNDANASVHPSAIEKCNGIDDNCNGTIDEGCSRYHRDQDGDGYGNILIFKDSTTRPSGYVSDSTDCDDNSASVHPNAVEICSNGIDDNCDGQIDENCGTIATYYRDADGDTYGNTSIHKDSIAQPVGYVVDNTDCDDANSAIHPNATEICDLIDNNCNGSTDEGCAAIQVGLRSNSYSVSEGSRVKIFVGLSAISPVDVTVNVSTSNGTATLSDYTPITNQLVTIPAGRTSKMFCIKTLADNVNDSGETFGVILSSPTHAVLSSSVAVVTIN